MAEQRTGGRGDERLPPSHLSEALARGRPAIARSHRLHRPRGGFCARGYCHQCPLATDAGTVLACETEPAGAGRRSFDPLRPIGLVGQAATPWFWERRFRRPAFLRQAYLGVLRRLSAAPALPPRAADVPIARPDLDTDVLVVGGGACGLAAAAGLARAGRRVAVITRDRPGGGAPLPDRLAARRDEDLATLEHAGAVVVARAVCLGVDAEERVALASGADGSFLVRFDALVVATGAYDRLPLVRGNDLPGLIGVRAFERLAARGTFSGASRVAVVADGPEAVRVRAAAERFGVRLAWAVPGDASGPLVRIEGRRRVRGARFATGGGRRCDVLVVGGMQPTFEIQAQAGLEPSVEGRPPTVRTRGEPAVPTLVVGEAAGFAEPERAVADAVDAARAWSASGVVAPPDRGSPGGPDRSGPGPPPDPLAHVCLCEDVRVRDVTRAVADGYAHLEHLKRRTGATTGPCQGKLCLAAFCDAAARAGVPPAVPAVRPPVRPVRIASLGGRP